VATATLLAAARFDGREIERRLARAGYVTWLTPDGLRVRRKDQHGAVTASATRLADPPDVIIDPAGQLLGSPPRTGLTCSSDGSPGLSDAWPTVVDIARAVAAEVPLTVLDDHAGTTCLVHPQRGPIRPEE
jgi:hypothetical protein